MTDLLPTLMTLLVEAGKHIPVLVGGLNVLNGALALAQKLLELRDKLKKCDCSIKRSTKRNSQQNP